MARASDRFRVAAVGLAVLLAATATACSSTNSASTTTTTTGGGSGGSSSIPASAFSDHTGVTADSVTVGNVSTLSLGGLFKGAVVGTQAYFDYVNSTGGVHGRKLKVASADDNFSGATNKQATQNAITNDFALVGSFSLEDSYGGTLLAFRRADNSWHGHKPISGQRRAIQLNWVTSQAVVDAEQNRHGFSTRLKRLKNLFVRNSAA